MKIHFQGDIDGLLSGLHELQGQLGIEIDLSGVSVTVEQAAGDIQVTWQEGRGAIRYEEPIHFFRALGLLLEQIREDKEGTITETPQFSYNGTMIDASRNAVPNMSLVKQMLRAMALMGLNGFMLYTEDTYEIKERPYFGYMRGRYTQEELREIDDYAQQFGIEVVACIQTLGHLAHALKWDPMMELRDAEDILLVGYEDTYVLIEQMVKVAAESLRTKRIHIGMDEAFALGLGRYLIKNGFRHRFDIMNEHLGRVLEITDRYGMKPMMWSDMYFHLLKEGTDGQEIEGDGISADAVAQIPKGVDFVYWDYYATEQRSYEINIERHQKLGSDPIFAGGVWIWGIMSPNYGKTWHNTNPALMACKKHGLREVFATAWGDNGQETNHLTMLPGLQLFAEHGYTAGEVDQERIKARFATCTGQSFDDYWELTYMDETPGVTKDNMHSSNSSKFLLWQDTMIGLYDKHVEGKLGEQLAEHYAKMAVRLQDAYEQATGDHRLIFDLYVKLSAVLAKKTTLGLQVTQAYQSKDKEAMEELATTLIPHVRELVDRARKAHRKLWMTTNKPFGWEVMDIRYGGVLARLQSAEDRLTDWVEGRIERMEELEAERLPFLFQSPPETDVVGQGHFYHRIVTASGLSLI